MQIIIALYLFNNLYSYLNANNYSPVSLPCIFLVNIFIVILMQIIIALYLFNNLYSYLNANNYSPVSLQ